jgi:hypothetical protein
MYLLIEVAASEATLRGYSVLYQRRSAAGVRSFEGLRDLVETSTTRVLERRHAVAVRDVDACACFDEDPDDHLMRLAALAEDHRLQEGRPAQIVDVVDVDLRPHELTDHFDVAAVSRRYERGASEAVRPPEVGLGSENLTENLDVARLADREQGVRASVVLEVDVCAFVDEETHHVRMASVDRGRHRRAAGRIPRVDVGSVSEQSRHLLGIALACGTHEARVLARLAVAAARRKEEQDRQPERAHRPVCTAPRQRGFPAWNLGRMARVHRRRWVLEELYWIALGCVLVVLASVLFAGVDVDELVARDSRTVVAPAAVAPNVAEVKDSVSPPRKEPRRRKSLAAADEVVVAAVRGDCWVSLRRESAAGDVLYEGLLVQGRRARVRGDRVFVRLGAGENVRVTVGGKLRAVPAGVADVVVEASADA